MTSDSKLNLGRVNKATLLRIKDLRALLVFLENYPRSSAEDIRQNFGWSMSKCGKSVRNLIHCGLVKVTNSGKAKNGKALCYLYGPTDHTYADVDRELPLGLETSGYQDAANIQRVALERKAAPMWTDGQAKRDPLDTYLMGTGLAPSLLFKQRSNHASTQNH